jgi:hypothetical protein
MPPRSSRAWVVGLSAAAAAGLALFAVGGEAERGGDRAAGSGPAARDPLPPEVAPPPLASAPPPEATAPPPFAAPSPLGSPQRRPAPAPAPTPDLAGASLAADALARALGRQRLWSTVELMGARVEVRSASCEEQGMSTTIDGARAGLRAAGLTQLRCVAQSGGVVFERDL